MRRGCIFVCAVCLAVELTSNTGRSETPLGTAFTYQGQLKDEGVPADGLYDLEFQLYDNAVEGTPIGDPEYREEEEITNGLFTVELDFGAGMFAGDRRWLEVSARRSGAGDPYSVLSPRQPLNAAPYAVYALGGLGGSGFWAASGNDIYNTNSGRVGIGTSSPSYPLHLSSTAQIMAKIASPNTVGTWVDLENTSTGGKRWGLVSSGEANGEGAGHLLLRAITDGRTVMTLQGTGDVGVGTASPAAKLDVAGTTRMSGFQLTSGAQSGYVLTSNASGVGTWQAPDADSLWNTTSGGIYYNGGDVGIGTAAPTARLDVSGRVRLDSTDQFAGFAWTMGPNGSYNAGLTHLSDYPNNGYVAVRNASSQTMAAMYVNSSGGGTIFANVKNFRVLNPRDAETEIVYACIEGPEAAAYIRGTATLAGGRAVVPLPEHFQDVAVPGGMTVQVTPCSAASKGLAVVEQALDHFVVQELLQGDGDYDFHWRVEAVRKGHEDYRVIRSRHEGRPAGFEGE